MSEIEYIDAEIEMSGTALERRTESAAVAHDPASLLAMALQNPALAANVEVVERLVALQERAQERNARAAFFEAMTAFRAECPPIPRTRENTQFQVTRSGARVNARYAALEDIDRIARPVAARHGLSWTWNTTVEGDAMRVTCRVAHVDGHAEETSVTMPTESKAGSSPQQKYGSAQTYGMRYSLVAALGLTTADEDVDGNAQRNPESVTKATREEIADIDAMIDSVGANRAKFLEVLRVERLEDLPASRVPKALELLEEKRRRAR